ncbi:MAG: hypothetical protein Q8L48_04645 [Archangium sp.]|nr:hypothetical protein [Archangium sp.]
MKSLRTKKVSAGKKPAAKKGGREELPSRALEHGAAAFGARYLRPGATLTPELDLAFALGQGSGMGPVKLLADLAPGKKQPSSFFEVHRNVAIAALRKPKGAPFGPVAHEEAPPPIEPDEAQQFLRTRLLGSVPIHLRALEAMLGPSCLLPAFVEGLEALKAQPWDTGMLAGLFPVLYGLLLRTPPDESNAARERLEALFTKRKSSFASAGLDIMLHGSAGIARRGYKFSLKFNSYQRNDSSDPSNVHDLCFCDGEPDFVAQQFAALWAAFRYRVIAHMSGTSPARLFFLGGDQALETELKVVDVYPGTKQVEAFESYRHLRSPRVVELMQHLAGPKSKVKAQAEAWLEQHA